ncbi:actin-like protein 6A isoform X2 [Hydra vulgaris]|uniref:Actin-like protein 6A isoform X2 n=1 Tax=Hydra vulgaris TaxID=6087 RepID=A0ABM4BXR7_HYDVU
MSGGVYGGDEVGAVVFDVGSYSTRVGYAGEDSPKGDISTSIGVISESDEAMEIDNKKPAKRYHFDPQHMYPISNKEIVNPLKDGMIEDWDLFEHLLNHIYKEHIRDDSSAHPVLMSEASWNTKAKRAKITELLFEKYDIPAFFLCKNAVLAAYAHGRSTGVIIDSGATQTSAVPVHDGYVLQRGIVRTPIAGNVLTSQCLDLVQEWGIDIVPSYMIKSKKQVEEEAPADFSLRDFPPLTDSYKTYMKSELIRDFQKNCLQVSDSPFVQSELENVPGFHYEFPNGYNRQVGIERFRISEGLFDTTHIKNIKGFESTTLLGAPHVINTCIGMCDIDIRPALYNSIVVVGGNTLINGFVERLNRELLQKTPNNMRLKLVSNNQSSERRFSSWIGGSILGSLGSFQQMWVSKQEYEESGAKVVEKKCP